MIIHGNGNGRYFVLAEDEDGAEEELKGHVGHANISQYVLKELTNTKATGVSKGKAGPVKATEAKFQMTT